MSKQGQITLDIQMLDKLKCGKYSFVVTELCFFFSSTFQRKKVELIVVTPASVSGSVKFFVRVHFSKTIKGIHLKLGILVHYQKRNQLQQGR
jgi:hypothetical protein